MNRVRHPFFPRLKVTPAAKAIGICAAISGSFEELLAIAQVGVRAQSAVFPVLRTTGGWLTAFERDRLWDIFLVPVYAVRIDPSGRIQAFECEAQDGMHITKGVPHEGELDASICDCGRPGARLLAGPGAAAKADAAD